MATKYFDRTGNEIELPEWSELYGRDEDREAEGLTHEPLPQDLIARSSLEDARGLPGEIQVVTYRDGTDVMALDDRPPMPFETIAYEDTEEGPRLFAMLSWESREKAEAGHWWLVDAVRAGRCRPSGRG